MDGQMTIFDYLDKVDEFDPLDAFLDVAGPFFYGGEGYIKEQVEKKGVGLREVARLARNMYCPYGGCEFSRQTTRPNEIESYSMTRNKILLAWISGGLRKEQVFSWDEVAEKIIARISSGRYGKTVKFSARLNLLGGA